MSGREHWSDQDSAREALRPLADQAVEDLLGSGRILLRRGVRRGLEELRHEPAPFLARLATTKLIDSDEHLTLTTDGQRRAALARTAIEAFQELPERLAEIRSVVAKYAGNEDAAKVLERTVELLPDVARLRPYVATGVRLARGSRLKRKDPSVTPAAELAPLTLTAMGEDGEEFERPISARDELDVADLIAERQALEAAVSATEACPACVAADSGCPDEVRLSWWLEVLGSGLPAPHLLELGRKVTPMYVRDTPNASEARFSRYGFHATGTLLHVFATARDRRVGDPTLLDTGERNHRKRANDVVAMRKGRQSPESGMCEDVAHWCGWQVDRLRRRLEVEADTFPSLDDAA